MYIIQSKVVSIKELSDPKENPTLCLSPLRVFDKCHDCSKFKLAQATNRVNKLNCKPHLNQKYQELLTQKRNLLDMLKHIEDQMKNL